MIRVINSTIIRTFPGDYSHTCRVSGVWAFLVMDSGIVNAGNIMIMDMWTLRGGIVIYGNGYGIVDMIPGHTLTGCYRRPLTG